MERFGNLVGRILLAPIFLIAGVSKIAGYAGTVSYMTSAGVPGTLLPLVIVLEVGGGLALLLGWKTRWAALALAVFTLVAALLFHFELGDRMQQIMFMKNLAIAGGLLFVAVYGAGALSLDARLGGN